MTSVTFYGGVSEIGGTKILIEHKKTRFLLDFGMSFNQAGKYFSEYLQPRKCSSLSDFFEFGLLPDIKGIYREDYLIHMGRPREKRGVEAIFLSHAHADHAQYIHFLRPDIPVYCTKETKVILQAVEKTGSNPLSDLVTSCEAFKFYENRRGGLSRVDRRKKEFVTERSYNIMEPKKRYPIGNVKIEMVPVDHSMPGACGFIIYTDEGNLVYTGDIRFHGYNTDHSREFVEIASRAKPKLLLCEGTRIEKGEIDSEKGVKEEISKQISSTKGLVFVEHPIRDLFRVKAIFEAARENSREFVVNLKLAYLLREMGSLSPLSLQEVKILMPRKRWGLISKEGVEVAEVERDYETWEREFIASENSITFRELRRAPKKYVVSMSFWEMNQLTDIQPKDAAWIKSTCEPFNEEMEIDERRKRNWLDHFKIKEYSSHASGHASGIELIDAVNTIAPDWVFPVHTEKPEEFKKLLEGSGVKVALPLIGKVYSL
jgi:ribonuclease J